MTGEARSQRNSVLKAQYPLIANPSRAIEFAIMLDDTTSGSAAADFLRLWQRKSWCEIELEFPEFLDAATS